MRTARYILLTTAIVVLSFVFAGSVLAQPQIGDVNTKATLGNDLIGGGKYIYSLGGLSIGTTTVQSGALLFNDGTLQTTAFGGTSQTVSAGNVTQGVFGYPDASNAYAFPAALGIGTNSTAGLPANGLYVSGNILIGMTEVGADIRLSIQSSASASYIQTWHGLNGLTIAGMYEDASGNGEFYVGNSADTMKVLLNSAGDSWFMGGEVGIGTASPGYKLDVVGGTTTARFQQNSSLAWTSGIVIDGPGSDTYIFNEDATNGYTRFRNTNTGKYIFTNSGGTNVITLDASTGVITATGGNSSNWNTAYGWGNHASAGYSTGAHATGDITGVTAGNQLTGGGTSGTVTLNVSEGAGSGLDADLLDGLSSASFSQGAHATGDITGVTAGSGLSGGGTSGTPTLSLNLGSANTWTVAQKFSAGLSLSGSQKLALVNISDPTHWIATVGVNTDTWNFWQDLDFQSYNGGANTTVLWLDGNTLSVGIGMANPGAKLQVAGNIVIQSAGYLDDDTTMGENIDDWIRLNGYIELKSNTDSYGIVLRDKDSTSYFGMTQVGFASYLADSTTYANYFIRGDGANVTIRGDLTISGSDILSPTLRFGSTASTGVYEFEDAGVCVGSGGCQGPTTDGRLVVEGSISVGNISNYAYNRFGTAVSDDALGDANDVYISDDLEVDGTLYLTGGYGAIVNSDIAENLLTKKGREHVLCEADSNCVVESYESELDYGDLVCINPVEGQTIMKCTDANSRLAVGFISRTSVLNMGNNGKYGYPVSVAGLVHSKVTNVNGDIYPGDLIVSADRDGYGMKNNNPAPGTVVGKAYDFCEKDECEILVFVALN